MIITVLNNNHQSHGQGPVNYVLNDKDHSGNQRKETPEILFGNPNLTQSIIDNLDFQHKYLSLSFNFRNDEKFTKQSFQNILEDFHKHIYAGLDFERINYLAVKHENHVHVIVPRVDLESKKSCNGHPPGKQNIELWNLFTSKINHENGWKQVQEKFSNELNVNKFDKTTATQAKIKINDILTKMVDCGILKDRNQLINYLEKNNIEITRKGENYLSLKLPSMKKAIRFDGDIYRNTSSYSDHKLNSVVNSDYLTEEQFKSNSEKLNNLVKSRFDFNKTKFDNTKNLSYNINKKEKVDGRTGVNRSREIYNQSKQKLTTATIKHNRFNAVNRSAATTTENINNKIKQLAGTVGATSAALFEARTTSKQSGFCSQINSNKSEFTNQSQVDNISDIDSQIAVLVQKISSATSLVVKSMLQDKLNSLLQQKEKKLIEIQISKEQLTKNKI